MKIYTYKDPFKLKDEVYWDEISSCPNLCVSQTLVMGLSQNPKYGYIRSNYDYIYTIDSLIKVMYEDWSNNPTKNIKQFISCSKRIAKIKDKELRQTFSFNKADVVEAIRMLVELDIRPEEINFGEDKSLRTFKDIYSDLIKEEEWNIDSNKIESIEEALKSLLIKEIEEANKIPNNSKMISQLEHINELMRDKDYSVEKIVIHGVHKFKPMIMRLIKDLKEIEIIFLINYIPEFERMYETWRKVYFWTGEKFTETDSKIYKKNNIGEAMALLLEGEIINFDQYNLDFLKFDNLSTFCDYVSDVYDDVSNYNNDSSQRSRRTAIFKMKEQFYATNMEDVNNILKQYHPQQFGNKHFLSYPIGQFFLSIYNMWDSDVKKLRIQSSFLKECLSVGFFQQADKPNPIEIYDKIEVYLENLKISDNYFANQLIKNLEVLIKKIRKIKSEEMKRNAQSLLRKFSIYTLKEDEVRYFINIIKSIVKISKHLFDSSKEEVNFKEHYENLLDILAKPSEYSLDTSGLSKEEDNMINDIKEKILEIQDIDIEGSIDDLKDSLHFYLNRVDKTEEDNNQASWIVRNFEQLDGGVLLKDSSNTDRSYHLGLVGDLEMNFKSKDLFPWPLDKGFFRENSFKNKEYIATINSYKEYKNFLRYSLFYAAYFLDTELKISYIENNKREINSPYYVLKILDSKFIDFDDSSSKLYEKRPRKIKVVKTPEAIDVNLSKDQVRSYMFCEYRFFLDEIVDGGTYYNSQYLQNLYYQTMLYKKSWEKLQYKDKSSIEEIVKLENEKLRKHFFLWSEITFIDAENKIIKEISDKQIGCGNVIKEIDENYIDTRKKFIYAQLTRDRKDKYNLLGDVLHVPNESKKRNEIYNLINYSSSIDKTEEFKKCEFCSQNGLCLYGYREGE